MKKFTKGCAVDVRGMSEVMFNAIMKTGDSECDFSLFNHIGEMGCSLLTIDEDGYGLVQFSSFREIITPTDILGSVLVKAIEDGYKPHFKEDSVACTKADIVLANGFRASGNDMEYALKTSSVIAYKPIEQPSIESKTLSEKVGPSMFDMSVKDFEIAKSCKQNLELLLAKEENKPYIEGLVKELGLCS